MASNSLDDRLDLNWNSNKLNKIIKACIKSFYTNDEHPVCKGVLLFVTMCLFITTLTYNLMFDNGLKSVVVTSNYFDSDGLILVDPNENKRYLISYAEQFSPFSTCTDKVRMISNDEGTLSYIILTSYNVTIPNCDICHFNSDSTICKLGGSTYCNVNSDNLTIIRGDNTTMIYDKMIKCKNRFKYGYSPSNKISQLMKIRDYMFTGSREIISSDNVIEYINDPWGCQGEHVSSLYKNSGYCEIEVRLWFGDYGKVIIAHPNPPEVKKLLIIEKSTLDKINDSLGIPLLTFSIIGVSKLIYDMLNEIN